MTIDKGQTVAVGSDGLLGEYVQCGWRRAWIMWDMDNGHAHGRSDPGKGYLWVFKTKRAALLHRRKQHSSDGNARLSMPFKIEGDRRFPQRRQSAALTRMKNKAPSGEHAPDKGKSVSVGCDAIVVPRAPKRKPGEACRCPVCGYWTRVYGACYVCLSVTGRRKKADANVRQPRHNKQG